MGSTSTVMKPAKKSKTGGKSKKGHQTMHNQATGKYVRQSKRTKLNKERAWKRHLVKHPNDEVNQKIIDRKLREV